MIFVNFKTYEAGTGEKAFWLAGICRKVAGETGVEIIPLVQAADIYRLAQAGFEVWVQHADAVDYGAHTGRILPEAVIEAGAAGVMLNHAENRLARETIGETIMRIKEAGANNSKTQRNTRPRPRRDGVGKNSRQESKNQEFKESQIRVLICVQSVEEAKEIERCRPDFIAYEPPELIGSRTISVAEARPEVIREFISQIRLPVVVGAGIHSGEDVRIALELGAKGVLVATDVVLAEKPEERLRELATAFGEMKDIR